jgi:hypothetical protein
VEIRDGSVIGDVRELYLLPPSSGRSNVKISDGDLKYNYNGSGANGFESRYLGYTQGASISKVDLSDVNELQVDVSNLKLGEMKSTTFTLQLNMKDSSGLESSVVQVVDQKGTYTFDKNAFIGNQPGETLDFANITGIWLGGDFRITSRESSQRSIIMKPLRFHRSST